MYRKLPVDWTCKLDISEKKCILYYFRIVTVDTWIVHFLSHQRLTYRNYWDHFTFNRHLLFLHWFKGLHMATKLQIISRVNKMRDQHPGEPCSLPCPGHSAPSLKYWNLIIRKYSIYYVLPRYLNEQDWQKFNDSIGNIFHSLSIGVVLFFCD